MHDRIAHQPTALCPTWCTEHDIDSGDGSVYHWSATSTHEGMTLAVGAAEYEEGLTELRIFVNGDWDYTVQQVRMMARALDDTVRLAEEG